MSVFGWFFISVVVGFVLTGIAVSYTKSAKRAQRDNEKWLNKHAERNNEDTKTK